MNVDMVDQFYYHPPFQRFNVLVLFQFFQPAGKHLGQYLSIKSVYADFLKSTNKKDFRQNHADEIAKYEEALQFLKQNSPDGKLPTMKDLRSEKELLVQQKDTQYETYQYFKDYHRELQTVCSNVASILNQPSTQKRTKDEHTL